MLMPCFGNIMRIYRELPSNTQSFAVFWLSFFLRLALRIIIIGRILRRLPVDGFHFFCAEFLADFFKTLNWFKNIFGNTVLLKEIILPINAKSHKNQYSILDTSKPPDISMNSGKKILENKNLCQTKSKASLKCLSKHDDNHSGMWSCSLFFVHQAVKLNAVIFLGGFCVCLCYESYRQNQLRSVQDILATNSS